MSAPDVPAVCPHCGAECLHDITDETGRWQEWKCGTHRFTRKRDYDDARGGSCWQNETEQLRARLAAAEGLLVRAADTLERTYDACDYPADGTSRAEITAKAIRKALASPSAPLDLP